MNVGKENKIEELTNVKSSRDKSYHIVNERAERFNKLMMRGNIKAAVRLLSANERGGILPLNEETMTEPKKKHPDSQPLFQHLLLCGPFQEVNPVIFDKLDESTIMKAASRTKGVAGPSMSNADDW